MGAAVSLAVEARQLTKRYRTQPEERPALGGVDLNIPPGCLYGLVGPDGAGKTTTLRILATVMPPTAGTASIAGLDVVQAAERVRPHIGYMPQVFSLYPDLSVRENLDFFADLQGVPRGRRQARIVELLQFARLSEFQSRRSEHLSGGMRKKLALACALIHEPQVLLLDEPTTGVDPVSRRELWHLLGRVIQQGVTVVVSTPYMDEAERCHTVGILFAGRLLTSGSPSELEERLPFALLELKARPRRAARQAATETDGVLAWHPVGDRLRLSVTDSQEVQPRLIASLARVDAKVEILRPAKATMEDVFIHLVEAQGDKT